MDELCRAFVDVNLDMEATYFETVAYESDDPDFTWGNGKEDSTDSDNLNSSLRKRHRNMSPKQLDVDDPVSPTLSKKVRAGDATDDSDLEETREWIKQHRRLAYSSNRNCSANTERDLNKTYPSTSYGLYPNNSWSSVSSPTTSSPSLNSYRAASHSPSTNNYFKTPTRTIENRRTEFIPSYKNYQLLGDSQLVRFSEKILNFRQRVSYTDQKKRRIGYCVSGQTISELQSRILNKEYPLSSKIIMLIGTNDLLRDVDFREMCKSYKAIVNKLKETAERVVLLTVPPVPKLAAKHKHWTVLKELNRFISEFGDEKNVFTLDLASIYISYSNTVSLPYFEKVMTNKFGSKPDLIHLNRDGFKMLQTVLDVNYFQHFR